MRILPIVLITDDKDMAIDYCNCFTKLGQIALILECPRILRQDYKAEILRTNNTLAILRPETVILGRVEENIKKLLIPKLGNIEIIEANKSGDWKHIEHSDQLIKNLGKEEFKTNIMTNTYTIAYEYQNDISDIIVQNLAIALGAELISLKSLRHFTPEEFKEFFYILEEAPSLFQKIKAMDSLKNIKKNLEIELKINGFCSSIIFITRGFPLGAIHNTLPSSHLDFVMLGYQIARILAAEFMLYNKIRRAILVDPGKTGTNELADIGRALVRKNCIIKKMFERNATTYKTMLSLEILPYDLCIISTHCGEVGGADQTIIFKASDNKIHKIRLWAVYAFAPHYDKYEMITVQVLYIPKEIDGINWQNKEKIAEMNGGQIFSELQSIDLLDAKVINHGPIKRVPFSQSLGLHDQVLMPRFHGFNSILPPFFVNNSCFSSYEMATNFMFGGARGYIGTVNSVQTWIAEEFIRLFFNSDDALPAATRTWLVQNKIYDDHNFHQYIYYGLPFTSLQCSENPQHLSAIYYLRDLQKIYKDYKKMIQDESFQDIKDRTQDVANFVKSEIEIFKNSYGI